MEQDKGTDMLVKLLLVCFGFLILDRIISIMSYLSAEEQLLAVAPLILLIINLVLAYYCLKRNRSALMITWTFSVIGLMSLLRDFSSFSGSDDAVKIIYALSLIMQLGLIILPALILNRLNYQTLKGTVKEFEEKPSTTKWFMKWASIISGIGLIPFIMIYAIPAFGKVDFLTNHLTWILAVAVPAIFLIAYQSIKKDSYIGLLLTSGMLTASYFCVIAILNSFDLFSNMAGGPMMAVAMFLMVICFMPVMLATCVGAVILMMPKEKKL